MVKLISENQRLGQIYTNLTEWIEIPPALRRRPIEKLPISVRLFGVLKRANIKVLGDLHGRSPYDFVMQRNCGFKTMKELEAVVHLVRHGEEATLSETAAISPRPFIFSVSPARARLRLADLPISKRLDRVLHETGINRLGDLHGRSSFELLGFPRIGHAIIAEIKQLITRASAGEFEDLIFRVPRPEDALQFADLPLSKRLSRLMKRVGMTQLGDLNGHTSTELLAYSGIGQTTITEIKQLIDRATIGEFTTQQIEDSKAPAILLRLIETGLAKLPAEKKDIFLDLVGGRGRVPRTLQEIGIERGLTRQYIRIVIDKVVNHLMKIWGVQVPSLLEIITRRCTATACPLTSNLLQQWLTETNMKFDFRPEVHVRIIAELGKGIAK